MLDYFAIFTRGGALLWTFQLAALRGDPVGSLIRDCFLEDRAGSDSYDYAPPQGAPYTLKWSFHNACIRCPNAQAENAFVLQGLSLVFVAVYQKALSLLYVDALLEKIRDEFAVVYKPDISRYEAFEDTFKKVLKKCEMEVDVKRKQHLTLKNRPHVNIKVWLVKYWLKNAEARA